MFEDVDLFHFLPLCRASRVLSKFESQHRWQWWLMFLILPTTALHLTFAVPVDLLLENPVYVGPVSDTSVSPEDKFMLR